MQHKQGYRVVPFSMERRMVAASATVGRERNNIHAFTEVDVSVPRRRMREHRERAGESLSFTAYIVACLARAVAEHPEFNARRSGGRADGDATDRSGMVADLYAVAQSDP